MYTMIPLLPLLPLFPFPLTWNPPCFDRIRPLLPWVARKLTLAFPPFAHLAPPHPKSRPPGVSQTQNRHSLGRHCEPNPYARLQVQLFQWQTKQTSVETSNRKSSSNNSSNRQSCSTERPQSKPHYSSIDAHRYSTTLKLSKVKSAVPRMTFWLKNTAHNVAWTTITNSIVTKNWASTAHQNAYVQCENTSSWLQTAMRQQTFLLIRHLEIIMAWYYYTELCSSDWGIVTWGAVIVLFLEWQDFHR
jgi:hypothetical protein